MKPISISLILFGVWMSAHSLQAKELYRYYTSPNTVQIFQDFDAKIWVRINRIPELSWKKITVPPTRSSSQSIPKTIFVHGQLENPQSGNSALIVNGTEIKLSEKGEFVLKVATNGPDFGLLVTVRDTQRNEDLKQTLGMRVYSIEPTKTEMIKLRKTNGFVGTHVYNQHRLAQLEEKERLTASTEPVQVIETKVPEKKSDRLEFFMGASFANYEQQMVFKQSPKNTYLRFNYEKSLGWLLGRAFWVSLDSRFSLFSLSRTTGDPLQFLNPEIKLGLSLLDQPELVLNVFTGTNYYTSFGNSNLGFKSFVGQAFQLDAKWFFSQSWCAQVFTKYTWIPSGNNGVFSSQEISGGFAIRKNQWGLFSEYSNLKLTIIRDARLSAVRFGFFASF